MPTTGVQRPAIHPPSKYLPTPALEYWYYAQVFYSIMATVLGLAISLLGAAMLMALGGVCLIRMGKYWKGILRAAALPLACGISFIAVQVLVHGESVTGSGSVSEFIIWMVGLVIVHYLALRPGFMDRFAMVALLIGLSTLPYMRSFVGDASRTGLERAITIGNPNDLGAWFGFCSVYFVLLGLETRRNWLRLVSWAVGIGCLLVVGLTVSRSPLFAATASVAVAFRRVLRRGFYPFVCLILMAWIAYGLGIFEQSTARYIERASQETGRFLVWPLAIQRFLDAPLAGVGVDAVDTYIPQAGVYLTPHNGFIYIGLASGVVPLLFFVTYWIRLFAMTLGRVTHAHEHVPYKASLLVYSLLICMTLNEPFKMPWMMVTFATAVGSGILFDAGRTLDVRARRRQAWEQRRATAVG
jgi:hypothetical protein